MLTLDLILWMFAGGALAAMVLALAGAPLWAQFVGFALVSSLLLATLRPMLPQIARTESNKVWFIPTEFTAALSAISRGFGGPAPEADAGPGRPPGTSPLAADDLGPVALRDPSEALAEARRQSAAATEDASRSGIHSGLPFDPGAEAGQHPGVPVRPEVPPVPPVPPGPGTSPPPAP